MIVWDPPRNLVDIPFLGRGISWYGLFFALGFFVGYHIYQRSLVSSLGFNHEEAKKSSEKLLFLMIVFVVIFARLAHVLFYDLPYYQTYPDKVFAFWEGGLASHGGAIGAIIAVWIYSKQKVSAAKKKIGFLKTLDLIVLPTLIIAGCIRLGNFFNQEIVGVETTVFWAVIFEHPVDAIGGVPRHPVQLYESLFYFFTAIGFSLFCLRKKEGFNPGSGRALGFLLSMVFVFRFFIEFLKVPLSSFEAANSMFNMGQWLSLPFILLGLYLLKTNRFSRGIKG